MTTPRIFESTLRKLRVPIYTPGSREFDLSVATSNFLYRFHQPTWVVRPRNGEDVATTVRLANEMEETITVKNGGHSYAGFSNARGGILVDLCDMKAVRIEEDEDEGGRVMIMSAGALWGDAYHELAMNGTLYDGWMVNGGRCPLVGVSGFLLGGGFGPFSRSVGMGMDQLLEVDMVNAEGNIITVGVTDDAESKEGKLFWALRGGGGGNFGIVTRLKIKVTELKQSNVVAGRHTWNVTPGSLENFKKMMIHFYTRPWENSLTIDTTWECDLSRSTDARPFATRFIAYYDGNEQGFVNEINKQMPEAEHKDFREQIIRRSLSEKSTLFLHETLFAQWSEENRRSLPSERAYTLYSSFVIKNDDANRIKGITEILAERIQEFRTKFAGERGTFGATWIHVGGEISNKGPTDTPYPWRQGNYCVYILVRWHEKWLTKEMGEFFDACKVMLKPHSMEQKASYVNFADRTLENWSEAYYGENLQKLRSVYSDWNPNQRKVLHFVQHIGESGGARGRAPQGGQGSRGPMLGGSKGGSRSGGNELGTAKPEQSGDGAVDDWKEQWENYTRAPPGGGYDDYVPARDRLLRC